MNRRCIAYLFFVYVCNFICTSVWTSQFSQCAFSQLAEYESPTIFARTGVTSLNLPNGSSIASPTIAIDDSGSVALDVNFVGNTGNPGLFFGSNANGIVTGEIVFNASDFITGDPSFNSIDQALFSVGLDDDLFLFDATNDTTTPLNFPLGATGASSLTLDSAGRIGGRLDFGFDGDAYCVFPVQGSGFPTLVVYAADSGIDVSSPYSFLFSPDMSRSDSATPPRIAAKVSANAGFDFEELRIFEASGTSILVAVETETDPTSPFSEFATNSISISDDGTKVAFQANDTAGSSGIYVYDDDSQAISLIGSVTSQMVSSIDFFGPDVNDDGIVVFRGDDSMGRSSVFVGDGNNLARLGGEGDSITTDLGTRQLGRADGDSSQSGAPRINNRGDIGWIFQYHDPTSPSSVADGSLVMLSLAQSCLPGDVNMDGTVDLLDVGPFVDAIENSIVSCPADVNQDGSVDLLDVDPFVQILAGP